jgi:putative hydrolase of the HAD superfamily
MNLDRVRALTFDCYGTLIDWERGILDALRPWSVVGGPPIGDRALLAAFAEAESACQREHPGLAYSELLRYVHTRIAAAVGRPPDPRHARRLAESVGDWPPFPDTVPALTRLAQRFALVIVSNVDARSFAGTRRRLDVPLHAVITAEEVGAYKPDPRMFEAAFARLQRDGIERDAIVHVAQSLFHDHVPAKRLGLRTVWVDRRGGATGGATPPPDEKVAPDLTIPDLATLADLTDRNA